MRRRDPQRARVLGLWTACWLAVFLLVGMVWLGEPSVQWPVLGVPLLWALLALRPRRRGYEDHPAHEDAWDEDWDDEEYDDRYDDRYDDGRWDEGGWDDDGPARPHPPQDLPPGPRPAERTDTVERPALRSPAERDAWERRRRG